MPESSDPTAVSALVLHVDLSDRTLTAQIDGAVEGTYDVTVGTDAHPTPRGEFAVRRVIWNPGWVPPNVKWANGKKPVDPGDPETRWDA